MPSAFGPARKRCPPEACLEEQRTRDAAEPLLNVESRFPGVPRSARPWPGAEGSICRHGLFSRASTSISGVPALTVAVRPRRTLALAPGLVLGPASIPTRCRAIAAAPGSSGGFGEPRPCVARVAPEAMADQATDAGTASPPCPAGGQPEGPLSASGMPGDEPDRGMLKSLVCQVYFLIAYPLRVRTVGSQCLIRAPLRS